MSHSWYLEESADKSRWRPRKAVVAQYGFSRSRRRGLRGKPVPCVLRRAPARYRCRKLALSYVGMISFRRREGAAIPVEIVTFAKLRDVVT